MVHHRGQVSLPHAADGLRTVSANEPVRVQAVPVKYWYDTERRAYGHYDRQGRVTWTHAPPEAYVPIAPTSAYWSPKPVVIRIRSTRKQRPNDER